MERFQDRQKKFQNFSNTESELKRQQFAVSLRRQKRLQHSQISRRLDSIPLEHFGPTDSSEDIEMDLPPFEVPESLLPLSDLSDTSHIYAQLTHLRFILSQSNCPIEEFVSIGVIPYVKPFAESLEESGCKFEALWILCNVASGPSTCVKELVKEGGIEIFMQNFNTNNIDFVENAIWGLGNIFGESSDYVRNIIDQGFLEKLQKAVKSNNFYKLQKVAAWTLRNICHYSKEISDSNALIVLDIADHLLQNEDPWIKNLAIEAISILTTPDATKIDLLLGSQFLLRCFSDIPNESLLYCTLKCIGNICMGSNLQTQALLNLNLLDKLVLAIHNPDALIVKEVYWILSNIAAGNTEQVETIEKHQIFPLAIRGVLHEDSRVKVEASFFISNYSKLCPRPLKKKLFKSGIMKILIEALEFKVPEFVLNLVNVFEIYIRTKSVKSFVHKGYDKVLDGLQSHTNPEVYMKCVEILENLVGVYNEI